MGYYTRVLSTSDLVVPLERLSGALERDRFDAVIQCDAGEESKWEQIVLAHRGGPEIASIERNVIAPGSLGEAELSEFAEDIESSQPQSAVAWLKDYFAKVRTIYALQHLSGTEIKHGGDMLRCVQSSIWNFAPSILQADYEGFSNESGYHILWQFSDRVKGSWAMGILKDGRWIHFRMDLGDKRHREAFFHGQVPAGIRPID